MPKKKPSQDHTALLDYSENDINERNHVRLARKWKNIASWRFTVAAGAAVATCVLITNLILLIWAKTSLDIDNGVATAFIGSCKQAKSTALWSHLAINILSTLLLGASNNCAQVLSSPSRADIDRVHGNGDWMVVGVPSIKNLNKVATWRTVLWVVLVLSSVPLHLFYNSVIFDTISANAYSAAVVAPEFLNNGPWVYMQNQTHRQLDLNSKMLITQISNLQKNASALTRLDQKDCIRAYGSSDYISEFGNILFVANDSGVHDGNYTARTTSLYALNSSNNLITTWRAPPGNSIMDMIGGYHPDLSYKYTVGNIVRTSDVFNISNSPIQYCLAERTQEHCKTQISVTLLYGIVACNLLKVIALVTTASALRFEPLANFGDALASFLEQPEALTKDLGVFARSNQAAGQGHRTYNRSRVQWRRAISTVEWIACYMVCTTVWASALVLLLANLSSFYQNYPGQSGKSALLQQGFGAVTANNTVMSAVSTTLIANVVLVNLPQLLLSFLYIQYNSIFTGMVQAYEYSKFASVRKSLRVSKPKVQQRSTFWLQLPYRYILPLLVTMSFFHWTISRSLFLIEVTIYNDPGTADGSVFTNAIGMSPLAIITSIAIGGVMMVALFGCSLRELDPGIPIANSWSIAFSTAAHADPNEEDPALKPLMYGEIAEPGVKSKYQRAGFSSLEVLPLGNVIDQSWLLRTTGL